jgi:hypothetical protein
MPQQSSDAIAKQFGGKPVTDIAAQFGGKVVEEPPQAPAQPEPPTPAGSGGTGIMAALRSLLTATGHGPALEGSIGVGKSILGTIEGGGQLIRNAIPAMNNLPEATLPISTQPSNTYQSIGKTAGDVGQFFAPAGAVRNTALALKSGIPAVNMGVRALLEGGAAAGVHSLQQGTTDGAATVGAMGAAGPLLGPVVGKVAQKVAPGLKDAAQKKVAQALGATKEKYKAISAKRAPEILERGLIGSRQGLLQDAMEKSSDAGKAIDDVLAKHADVPLSTASVLDALEEAKSGFMSTRSVSAAEAMQSGVMQRPGARLVGDKVEIPVVLDERVVSQLDKLKATVREMGDEVPIDKLVALRRVWDGVVSRAGGYAHRSGGSAFGMPLAEQTEAWAKKEGATALRKLFAENVPDLQSANKEYAFWADIRNVLKATEARTQAQGPGLGRVMAAGVGAGIGAGGGSVPGALVGSYVIPKLQQAVTSSRWRLVDANLRNKLADALMSDSPEAISAALGRVMAVITSTSGGEK